MDIMSGSKRENKKQLTTTHVDDNNKDGKVVRSKDKWLNLIWRARGLITGWDWRDTDIIFFFWFFYSQSFDNNRQAGTHWPWEVLVFPFIGISLLISSLLEFKKINLQTDEIGISMESVRMKPKTLLMP